MPEPYYPYPCDLDQPPQGNAQNRGITVWGPTGFCLAPSGEETLNFTGTTPECYSVQNGGDVCIMQFNAYTLNDTGNDTALSFYLNNDTVPIGGTHIGGLANRGVTTAYDLVYNNQIYNDNGVNQLKLKNLNDNAYVEIANFRIVRVYKICSISLSNQCQCGNYPTICSAGSSTGYQGAFDETCDDRPCNCESGGGRGLTHYHNPAYGNEVIQPHSWMTAPIYFDWSPYNGPDYLQDTICILNLNQMWATNNTTAGDAPLIANLNGENFTTFYLSKNAGQGAFPSFDLTQAQNYNDGGFNWISLYNDSDVPITFSPPTGGGVDIYRIYESETCCPPHSLTVNCDSEQGYVTISPSSENGYYNWGTWVEITAHANEEGDYHFSYWTGDYFSNNTTISVKMIADLTITPVFYYGEPPTHQLTIDTHCCGAGNPIDGNIYIDENNEGNGYASTEATQGSHSLYLDNPGYNNYTYENNYLYFTTNYHWDGTYWQFDGEGYTNPQNLFIYADTYIEAWYCTA
jgi:hypothetical protein